MRGKTVVITGGTSGIGEVAAVTLARMGARIVLIARDKTRADATLARLRDSVPGIAHSVHLADLFRLAEMKRVAAQIADREPRLDVLINNAGALFRAVWRECEATRHVRTAKPCRTATPRSRRKARI
jgi:NAD(P)-dependent dehydrogenase (short-subunit alcohol dehydrogenase family)